MTRARQILKWRSYTQFGWMYQGDEWKHRDRKRDGDVVFVSVSLESLAALRDLAIIAAITEDGILTWIDPCDVEVTCTSP